MNESLTLLQALTPSVVLGVTALLVLCGGWQLLLGRTRQGALKRGLIRWEVREAHVAALQVAYAHPAVPAGHAGVIAVRATLRLAVDGSGKTYAVRLPFRPMDLSAVRGAENTRAWRKRADTAGTEENSVMIAALEQDVRAFARMSGQGKVRALCLVGPHEQVLDLRLAREGRETGEEGTGADDGGGLVRSGLTLLLMGLVLSGIGVMRGL